MPDLQKKLQQLSVRRNEYRLQADHFRTLADQCHGAIIVLEALAEETAREQEAQKKAEEQVRED